MGQARRNTLAGIKPRPWLARECRDRVSYIDGIRVAHSEAEDEDFSNEEHTARHESAHAVAAWMLGIPIVGMQFFDDDSGAFAVVEVIPPPRASSLAELWIYGRQYAFVRLAGVIGTQDALSENPLFKVETQRELAEALCLLSIPRLTEQEARESLRYLISLVYETFQDKVVHMTVEWLAKNLLRVRKMTGEEVTALIEHTYKTFKDAEQKPTEKVTLLKAERAA